MTMEELKALGLTEEQAGAVLDAHSAEAKKMEDKVRELQAREQAHLRGLLVKALENAGTSPDAARLLGEKAAEESLALDDHGGLLHADKVIEGMKKQWPGLFVPPAQEMHPPLARQNALTAEMIGRMSAEEINQRWDEVKGVLRG